jgi:hypothetical protein
VLDPAAPSPPPARRARRPVAALALHLGAGVLFLVILICIAWFVKTNPALPHIFAGLLGPWQFGGGTFEWAACGWGIAGIAIFTVIGGLYLEGLELYLPRSARLCLAFLLGMGLCGFVFELLAIPYLLNRPLIGVSLMALLMLLGLRAWRQAHREPEGGYGGDAGPAEHQLRRMLARQAFRDSLTLPRTLPERVFRSLALLLIGLISLTIAWHAILFPEVYWDSLILYLGYARQTFLAGGFPIKVTGQVGIGLGANYPHLYSVLGSGIATLAGFWSELPQRIIAPLCGLASTVLVYHAALRISRHVNFALCVALLYRATPIVVAWDQYASDYSLALLFGAGFLYLAILYVQTRLRGYLWSATLLIALSMHLNYLMGILWAPWAVMLLAAHLAGEHWKDVSDGPDPAAIERREAPWIALRNCPRLGALIGNVPFWLMILGSAVVASTWLVRNYFVTGNPVYAFFFEILGGKNINPEVMRAAAVEWQANGWGIGLFGKTLAARMHGALAYFLLATPSTGGGQAYLLQPLFPAFVLGGVAMWLGAVLATPWAARTRPLLARQSARAGWVVMTLTVALLAFHFILAPFYLYQIIDVVPCLALLVALAWPLWRLRPWRWLFGAAALWVGLVPGLAMALMGFKIVGGFELPGGRIESPITLYPLRHPLPITSRYYRMRFGDDPLVWDYLNTKLPGIKLLTHENRDLVLDPSIEIINLDDWDMQQLWSEPDMARRVQRLVIEFNIQYYLRVANEAACPTNALMGTAQWEKLGLMKLVYKAGDSALYQLTPHAATAGLPLAPASTNLPEATAQTSATLATAPAAAATTATLPLTTITLRAVATPASPATTTATTAPVTTATLQPTTTSAPVAKP